MKQNEPNAPRPAAAAMEDADELRLRGGLHGRMAGGFGALQTAVDALRRYLAGNAAPEVYATAQALLGQMDGHIASLERLSANAASLAMGAAARGADNLVPLELAGYLAEMTACANEALALRGLPARMRFANESGCDTQWALASTPLLDGIITNMLSNLVQARRDGTMCLTLTADRALLYTDNGPGMDLQEARALLEEGRPGGRILSRGAIGLLLVRDYAAALGWPLQVMQQPGLCVRFALPAFDPAAQLQQLCDPAGEKNVRAGMMAAHLDRELDGVFGPARRGTTKTL